MGEDGPVREPVRLRIDLAYDGSRFHGWATQPELRTVQGELERALATVLRLDAVATTCAGRTDTGVHARGQVVHVDLAPEALDQAAGRGEDGPEEVLVRRLNGVLPDDVRVRHASQAPDGFDARFAALWRRYSYRLADHAVTVDPLVRGHVVSWPRPLDERRMNVAAAALLGEHDFASYCKRREGATTVRRLLELRWTRTTSGLLEAVVRADAFCHHMVRALVGALVAVGEGRRTTQWPAAVLEAGAKDPAVLVMPPLGLTLEEVAYPPPAELRARAEATRVVRTGG
jgi:tRNA pseudouridine38-40 synthase